MFKRILGTVIMDNKQKSYETSTRNRVIILNLGCGHRTSPQCVNIDWSVYLIIKKSRLLTQLAVSLLDEERRKNLQAIDGEIVVHDLSKGIPFPNDSVDAVYSSHVLEHIDRDNVPKFFGEILRVLKPGAIHRICVPDLEILVRRYLESLEGSLNDPALNVYHDNEVFNLYEQSVRREPYGTKWQPKTRRFLENLLLGDARKRGQTHQWMYDRVNLPSLLSQHGFEDIGLRSFGESNIPSWTEIGLETNADETEYKKESLYVESRKPALNLSRH